MKKHLAYLILGTIALVGFSSCQSELESTPGVNKKTHKVYFKSNQDVTKTAISIEDNMVTPDWRGTKDANVHLFEVEVSSQVASYGEEPQITPSADYKTASFKAAFPMDITIEVDPNGTSSSNNGNGSSTTPTGPFTYSAVIAQKSADSFTFKVPSTQYPNQETLIDPDADFLIGYSRNSYEVPHIYTELVVDLFFDRPVALSRISITNFADAGEKIKSVVINSETSMTGSVSYSDIDFANGEVSFTADEGTRVLTLSYGDGAAVSTEAFDAYFVSIPGTVKINSMVVTTDKYVYTRTIEGGKEFTFSEKSFKNINLDLSKAAREAAEPEDIKWYKASVLEDGIDYIIVSANQAMTTDGTNLGFEPVSPSEGIIEFTKVPAASMIWRAVAHIEYYSGTNPAGHYTLENDGKFLQRHSNKEEQTGAIGEVPSTKKYYVWDYDGEHLYHLSDSPGEVTDYCLYYDNGWLVNYGTDRTQLGIVHLYTSRPPIEMSFSKTEMTFDKAGTEPFVAPTLSAPDGVTVTYASDNEAVAKVDPATGAVTIEGIGTAVITATAPGNADRQAGAASYTLRIVNSSVTTNFYTKVTSTSNLEEGAQYLLVFEGLAGDTDGDGNPKVFKPILSGNTFSKDKTNALDVEIESGTISSNEFEGSHLTLESGYYLMADAVNRYLYPTGSSSGGGTLSAEAAATNKLTITFDNGIAQIKVNSGNNYLVWSTSSHYFSSNAELSGKYSTGICLYKLYDGRQPQELGFSPTTATYDLYTPSAFVKPTLSTAYGTVTYSSSDDTIAEVDNSGNIIGKKKGTVTITATAEGNTQYKPGSASYKLEVIDTTPVTPTGTTYKKVTSTASIISGKPYVIVYENGNSSKAFKPILNDAGTEYVASAQNAIDASVSNGIIEGDAEVDGCQIVLEADGTSYKFKVGDKYLYLGNSKIQVDGDNSRKHIITISSTSGKATFKRDGGSGSGYNYYLAFSDNYFHQASSDSGNLALYMLDDGSNPGGGEDPVPTITTYTRISTHSELVSGTYLIVSVNNTNLVFKGGTGSGAASGEAVSATASPLAMSGNSISITGDANTAKAYEYVITRTDDSITLKGELGYLKRNTSNSTTYIGYEDTVTSASTFTLNTNPGSHNSGDDAVFFSTKNGTYDEYLYYNTSGYFKIGGSGKPTMDASKHGGVFLYKKVENP